MPGPRFVAVNRAGVTPSEVQPTGIGLIDAMLNSIYRSPFGGLQPSAVLGPFQAPDALRALLQLIAGEERVPTAIPRGVTDLPVLPLSQFEERGVGRASSALSDMDLDARPMLDAMRELGMSPHFPRDIHGLMPNPIEQRDFMRLLGEAYGVPPYPGLGP